ncbi:MAG: hypothetical protein RL226_99 [Bacteroidota bacterium]|jgi:hypothetical protein
MTANEPNKKRPAWLSKLGLGAFLFFLLKGLAYIFFGGAILKMIGC